MEVLGETREVGRSCQGPGADDEGVAELTEVRSDGVPEPSPDAVSNHGVPNGPAHDEADTHRVAWICRDGVHDKRGARLPTPAARGSTEVGGPLHSVDTGQHRSSQPVSGGETVAALAATRGDDGATGSCAHPQPEAVRLAAAAVVGLKRTLTQGDRLPNQMNASRRPDVVGFDRTANPHPST